MEVSFNDEPLSHLDGHSVGAALVEVFGDAEHDVGQVEVGGDVGRGHVVPLLEDGEGHASGGFGQGVQGLLTHEHRVVDGGQLHAEADGAREQRGELRDVVHAGGHQDDDGTRGALGGCHLFQHLPETHTGFIRRGMKEKYY